MHCSACPYEWLLFLAAIGRFGSDRDRRPLFKSECRDHHLPPFNQKRRAPWTERLPHIAWNLGTRASWWGRRLRCGSRTSGLSGFAFRSGSISATSHCSGHTKLESTVRYLGIEVDDALEIAEQTEVEGRGPVVAPVGALTDQKPSFHHAGRRLATHDRRASHCRCHPRSSPSRAAVSGAPTNFQVVIVDSGPSARSAPPWSGPERPLLGSFDRVGRMPITGAVARRTTPFPAHHPHIASLRRGSIRE